MVRKHTSKVQFLKNVGSGWLAVFIAGLIGFVVLPLNLKYLGEELYGISVLVVSTTTLFTFLNMGMQPALLRFFSHAVVTKNQEEIRSLSSIAQLLLGGLGVIGGAGFLCVYPWFISIYDVPETVLYDLFILFLAIAFDFWGNLFLIPFAAIIQASNRYDLGNIRSCLGKVTQLIVLFLGYTLFTPSFLILAMSVFVGALYQLVSLIFLAYKTQGNMIFFRWDSLRWNIMSSLFSFSFLNLVYLVCLGLSTQIPVLIIGKTLGVDMVSAFAPALYLSTFCTTILTQISAPLVPIASQDSVENGGKNIGRWAILMGEVVACIGCSIITIFAILGSEIITFWLGESFAWTGTIVTITVTGIIFSNIQTTNYRLALGGKTSLVPYVFSIVVMTVVISLGTFWGTCYGGWSLLGVAVFITLAKIIRNTVFISFIFSWQLGYSFANYTWRVHVKPLLLGLPVIGIFYALKYQFNFSLIYLPSLVFFSALVVGVYFSLCWMFVLKKNTKKRMLKLIQNKLTGSMK